MSDLQVIDAALENADVVAGFVTQLLLELEPDAAEEVEQMGLSAITLKLMSEGRVRALLALHRGEPIGVLTLHECAAIYAGGVFGEISELYVMPAYRSEGVGERLLDQASRLASQLGWQRLEVGTPPVGEWPRTRAFYERNGFLCTGSRLRQLIPSD